jgi:hypothetical protein
MRTPLLGTLARLLLVVPAAGWLLYAFQQFLGAPFPDRGLIVSLPMDGELHFERGTIHAVSGAVHAIDFGPWWLVSLIASVLVLLAFAWRGCATSGAAVGARRVE